MTTNETKAQHTPAALIQREREAADIANHRERVLWLASEHPRWSCGTLIDAYMRNELMRQSKAAIGCAKETER